MRRSVNPERVRRELLPDQSPELLRELHLLTRDGKLNADALRKLKQVNHLVNLLRPALDDVWERYAQPQVVDAGSGNAYLGFILYELFFKGSDKGALLSIESREELTERAKQRAKALGYQRMSFATSALEAAPWPERPNLVLALHACDTATDDALAAAVKRNADHVAVVPCCQAEVARQLEDKADNASPAMRALFEHPMHRREFGSHLTNVIRALVLESHGYRVTVTELTGWEHSLKNELILGKKVHRDNPAARERLGKLLAETGVLPKLVRLLEPARGAVTQP
ncbi:MAG: class I SAM-dependent methyltransferase [Myxococcaceae bacterium]